MNDVVRQVTIKGRVQGVGYRAWLAHSAVADGLAGWVRNRRDGSVEAVLAGPAKAVDAMVAKCRRGPSAARVTDVVDEAAGPDALDLRAPGERFSVLPTL
ncbi:MULTISPECIES: acylphosphatase [Rhodopseudomonas]|uniref:acylphosphatase n=1 Tax=Rhodopseudomonas palustris TaxID=1076 RepID=A0A0D7F387_RHOPL|nr:MULTISPECIES: acylphosphatase [Rhodopseudomonas]KIZ47240.1 acylphosphatase [Rhodopseudomonas palustris]MDF3811560.1 acylphosphatase [Rhodopseudomonas sp. BAL398]WOK19397.1 acylphosphatase [Rhodopseudomonas sp. BAL398]